MEIEEIDTLVVGAGQAGIAMSEHLGVAGVPHVILERDRIAERWRSWRWDSLVANGPAWHDRFPGMRFEDLGPDDFASKDRIVRYFEAYAKKIKAPIRTGVEVHKVVRRHQSAGFLVSTSKGDLFVRRVVAATGPFQTPTIPAIGSLGRELMQMHSSQYQNPAQLPAGNVLVVGAGASGAQIADELQRAGKQVYLSVGAHNRPPRFYRGRDYDWWLGVLGMWDTPSGPSVKHVTIAVSGMRGGETVDFRRFSKEGVILVGSTRRFIDHKVIFSSDLVENVKAGDADYLDMLDAADKYVADNGLNLPEDPSAREFLADPDCMTHPLLELDLAAANVSSIIWATGYKLDFSWLKVDVFDAEGNPEHYRGVGAEPGIYFLGLPFLSCRGSSFIWGVWHDAKYIAGHIEKQRYYEAYNADATASGKYLFSH